MLTLHELLLLLSDHLQLQILAGRCCCDVCYLLLCRITALAAADAAAWSGMMAEDAAAAEEDEEEDEAGEDAEDDLGPGWRGARSGLVDCGRGVRTSRGRG